MEYSRSGVLEGQPMSDSERPSNDELGEKKQQKDVDAVPTPESRTLGPPPDGGLKAWLQVLGSWVVLFNTWGLVNSFGVFQTYYEDALLISSSSSDISWIGSVQACLVMAGGFVSGPLYDAGYFLLLLTTGLILIVFGMFMTSLCSMYWQIFLAQGICVGVGCGLSFLPATAILAQWFDKRRAWATGLASVGSPLAGIVVPIIFGRLQPSIGFGWATRVIAFMLLGLNILPIMVMRTRLPPSRNHRALVDKAALKDRLFMIYLIGGFFGFLAQYVPYFYTELFAVDHRLTSPGFAPYTVTIMNAGSIPGRFLWSYLADRPTLSAPKVMSFCATASGVLTFAWLGIHNYPGLLVFGALYGAVSGGIVSLQPVTIFEITPDHTRVGTRLGMTTLTAGIAVLIGTPLAGAILGDASEARWKGLRVFTAASLLIGALLFVLTVIFVHRRAGHKVQQQV